MRVLSPRITNKSHNDIGSGIDRSKATKEVGTAAVDHANA